MMSFAELSSPEQLAAYLGTQCRLAYVVLFLGAFLETLIPLSLAVPGEIFFLSGALLAGMEALELWAVMTVLYAGGIMGDNVSYWLGRRYGASLFARLSHWPLVGRLLRRDNYLRGMEFFRRRGAIAVFTARLSGPLSWVTPAMAGIFRLDYPTFLRFNTLGVIIGIGEFIILGYFCGGYLPTILAWLDNVGIAMIVFIGVFLATSVYCWHHFTSSREA
ncbi:MAG: DedA family protein [Desulfobulbaceae bacterium]